MSALPPIADIGLESLRTTANDPNPPFFGCCFSNSKEAFRATDFAFTVIGTVFSLSATSTTRAYEGFGMPGLDSV